MVGWWSHLESLWNPALLRRGWSSGAEQDETNGLLDGPLAHLLGLGWKKECDLGGGRGPSVSLSASVSFRRPNFCKASNLTTSGFVTRLSLEKESNGSRASLSDFTGGFARMILGLGATGGGHLAAADCECGLLDPGLRPTGTESIVWSTVGHKGVFFVEVLFRK